MMGRRGFTIIEVMAVVVLIGVLAGMAALSMINDARRATRQDVIARLTDADATARLAAKRLGPTTLRIDLDQQKLWLVTPDPTTREPRPGHVMRLAPDYRITEVAWVDPQPADARNARPRQTLTHDAGTVELPYSGEGMTRTYVLRLQGPGIDPDTGEQAPERERTTWLLFSGLTGQTVINDEPETIDNLLALLTRTRPDAD